MKLLSIIGTRPQFIKLAPLLEASKKRNILHVVVNTGQHYDYEMDQIFIDELGLTQPQYNLGVGSGTQSEQISKIILGLEKILIDEKPDVVLIYGDTNSTLGGAVCASKLNIRVAHVEAGIRSFDWRVTEEANRVVADSLSTYLFAADRNAFRNLKRERKKGAYYVGNIAIENFLSQQSKISEDELKKFNLGKENYLLATLHHDINVDVESRLSAFVDALVESGQKIVFPLHPRTLKNLNKFGLYKKLADCKNITLSKPVSYRTMLTLEKYAKMIITDSGGIQFEGYILGLKTLVLSDFNELPETVESGICRMIPADKQLIIKELNTPEPHKPPKDRFFHKKVSARILDILNQLNNSDCNG